MQCYAMLCTLYVLVKKKSIRFTDVDVKRMDVDALRKLLLLLLLHILVKQIYCVIIKLFFTLHLCQ